MSDDKIQLFVLCGHCGLEKPIPSRPDRISIADGSEIIIAGPYGELKIGLNEAGEVVVLDSAIEAVRAQSALGQQSDNKNGA